jgi:hypothetical protein
MTVTIVPANPGFFVIRAHPGKTAYEIFSQVSVIAWRIEDESRMLPEPITRGRVPTQFRRLPLRGPPPQRLGHEPERASGRTHLSQRNRVAGGLLHTRGAGNFPTSDPG